MIEPTEIIVTPRLVLRSPVADDLAGLYRHVLSDAVVMRHAFAGRPLSFDEAEVFFGERFDHQATGRKLGVLAERATKQVIGFAGLLLCDVLNNQDYEIGFMLRRSAWGLGYATEIGRAQLQFGFTIIKCRRLLAIASPENTASIAALKKIGMEFHGSVHQGERGVRQIYIARNRPHLCPPSRSA